MPVLKARIGNAWVDVGGSGTDEVWVGPTDPIATVPTAEVWYDTDAAQPVAAPAWGSARGIIAVVPLNSTYPLTTTASTIATLSNVATVNGRRYAVHATYRTLESSGAIPAAIIRCTGIPGDTTFNDHFVLTNTSANGYGGGNTVTWTFSGTGATVTLALTAAMQSGTTGNLHGQAGSACNFWIEDIGPVAGFTAPSPGTGVLYARIGGAGGSWSPIGVAGADPATYVKKTGDTMTGALTLPADPTLALQAAPRQYVDHRALGIVAVGSFTFGENTLFTDGAMLTSTISMATGWNRWYRATIDIRALNAIATGAINFAFLTDGGSRNDRWLQIMGTDLGAAPGFTNFHGEWVFGGDGATHNYGVLFSGPNNNIWGYASGGHFYVEDLGG